MIVAGPRPTSDIENNEEGTGDRMATRPEEEQHWSSSTREGEAWPTVMDRREAECQREKTKKAQVTGWQPGQRSNITGQA